jgi:hypothetical protein
MHLRRALWLVTACLGLTLLSCEAAPIVHFFNNSGYDVGVVILDEEHAAPASGEIEFDYPYAANGGMSIRRGQCLLTYLPPSPPWDFMKGGITRGHLRTQLEPDWRIFVVRSGEEFPAAARLDDQPDGFPLVPQRSGACD